MFFEALLLFFPLFDTPPGRPYVFPRSTIASPSHEWVLKIDPNSPEGRRSAHYEMSRFDSNGSTVVWQRNHLFTLSDTVVGDSGIVCGWASVAPPDEVNYGLGAFHVVVLAADGSVRMDESTSERRYGMDGHSPIAVGALLFEKENRLLMRVRNDDLVGSNEVWWVYDLHSAKRIATIDPLVITKDGEAGRIFTAQRLGASTMVLLHAAVVKEPHKKSWMHMGSRFALFDLQGECLWSAYFADDLAKESFEPWLDLWKSLWSGTSDILDASSATGFTIGLVHDGAKVRYSVGRNAAGEVAVEQVARDPWVRATGTADKK